MRRITITAAIALFASACSPGNDLPAATAAVDRFHNELNAGQSAGIYARSDSKLRNITSEHDFVAILDAVHRKLGKFQSAGNPSWNDQITTGGHFVTLIYPSKYERGAAEENFVFEVGDGQALLAGYHVNSQALILN